MKTIIIAEAGVNHNGSIVLAKNLIDAAAAAGVDYVKFQTFKADKLVSNMAAKAVYQNENTGNSKESQLQMLQKLELSAADHHELIAYCKLQQVKFFSTAFDVDSLVFLKELGLNLFKIPSGELTNFPYLEQVALLAEEIILSTGMSTMEEIGDAIQVLKQHSNVKITILHCNTAYPTPYHDVNLLAMLAIGKQFNVEIGYSDHTLGIEVPIAAVALGAKIIEKHFTLDRTLPGPDHAASLEPNELVAMVKAIRNIELAISGNGLKTPSDSEIQNMAASRKSIIAKIDIKKGDQFTATNLTIKRPGTGISPMNWNEVIHKFAKKDFDADSIIEL